METNGVMPVMDVSNRSEGMGMMGGGWLWIVFLFFLIAWGGNGMFGGNNNGQISNDFLYTNLKNTVDMGFNQVANQGFQTQRDIANGVAGLNTAVAESRYAAQQCCCETNRNIDSVRYDAALNTAGINTTATANTQKILDKLCQIESNAKDAQIAQLQMDLQAAQLTLGNAQQTRNIIGALKPPTYLTPCAYPYYQA